MRVELGRGNLLRARLAQLRRADGVDREAPQVLAQVAVAVDVPVVAVVHEPLRRDLALGLAVVLAVVMPDPHARALQNRGGDHAEMPRLRFAPLGLENADALLDFFPGMVAAAEDRAQALAKRLDLAPEHAGLKVAEHAKRTKKREHLGGIEPDAGELVARTR